MLLRCGTSKTLKPGLDPAGNTGKYKNKELFYAKLYHLNHYINNLINIAN